MARKDIILDDDNDLLVINGDFSINTSDNQHIDLIFKAFKGEFRWFPRIGFGALFRLKQTFKKRDFLRDFKVELEKDGYKDVEIHLDDDQKRLIVDVN